MSSSRFVVAAFLIGAVQAAFEKSLSDGPERCLASDSPFWCLAEETSAGITRTLGREELTSGKSGSLDPLEAIGELAASTFDLGISSSRVEGGESRSKRRRRFAFLILAVGSVLAMILPFKLKAIAVMAGTALLVGKLALIIASLVGLKKLVHKQSDENTHVHYSGHRSDADSHYLAYSEHSPGPGTQAQYASPDERCRLCTS